MGKIIPVTRIGLILCLIGANFFFISPSIAATTDCTVEGNTKCTVTFSYSGAPESWTVPEGITEITFDVRGAQGGGGAGGQGGIDTGTITVASGSNLIIRVGGQGTLGLTASGGFNGGGSTNAGDTAPGSGGGASDIRLTADTLAARIVIAGGGGGQSTYCWNISQPVANAGGAGGGTTGGNGGNSTGCWAGSWGGGGTQVAGGIKGGTTSYANTIGSLGLGGNGKGMSAGGGAGGGGYYGGGGAAVGAGGGGSSYVNPTYVTNYSLTRGGRTGNGLVTLTYPNFQASSVLLSTNDGSLATFRMVSQLTATSPQNGRVTFSANGQRIAGCINILLISNATCAWKPSKRGTTLITVSHKPSGPYFKSSASLQISVVNRTGRR